MTIDIKKLIEEIDEDGSGKIEFDEFKQLMQNWWFVKVLSFYFWYNVYILLNKPIFKGFYLPFDIFNKILYFLNLNYSSIAFIILK